MNYDLIKARMLAAKDKFNFDQMAAQDDYIHSPDLNVRGHAVRQSTENRDISSTGPGQEIGVNRQSHTVSKSQSVSMPADEPGEEEMPSVQRKEKKMKLLSVVSDIVSEHSVTSSSRQDFQSQCSALSETGYISDDESVDDDDFIFNMIRKDSEPSKNVVCDGTKNPNRFMEDLDRRLSMPPDEEKGVEEEVNQPQVPISSTNGVNKWEWMKSAASSRVHSILWQNQSEDERIELGPLKGTGTQTNKRLKDEEDFHVAVSTSILGDDEHAELERIRLATQAHPVAMLLNSAKENPQFVFIALTIVLGSAAYFYSRHRGSEDGVP